MLLVGSLDSCISPGGLNDRSELKSKLLSLLGHPRRGGLYRSAYHSGVCCGHSLRLGMYDCSSLALLFWDTFFGYFGILFGIFSGYFWNTFGILLKHFCNSFGVRLGYFWDTLWIL